MITSLSGSSAVNAAISRRNPKEEYELLTRIGSGTYGEVYKARRVTTNEAVAVKLIKLEPGDDFGIIQQEIIMMSECNQANIVAYYGSYLRKDLLWIVMEYCGGGSVQDIYHAIGALNEPAIAFIIRETLKGLDYLHRKGMMHRDIKGANILLTDEGHVKLADFGVAAQITATISKRKSFIGTPYWMAPEVAAVERKGGYDQLCDIWAVGITAIEFAEKEPPMFDLHPMRFLYIISKSGFKPPVLKDRAKWSPSFHNFLKASLTKNPKKRPPARELLQSPFVTASDLGPFLSRQLIEQMRNPNAHSTRPMDIDDEEDDPVSRNRPQRIPSKKSPPRPRSSSADNNNSPSGFQNSVVSRVTPLTPGLVRETAADTQDESMSSAPDVPIDERSLGSSVQDELRKISPDFERLGLTQSSNSSFLPPPSNASTVSSNASFPGPAGDVSRSPEGRYVNVLVPPGAHSQMHQGNQGLSSTTPFPSGMVQGQIQGQPLSQTQTHAAGANHNQAHGGVKARPSLNTSLPMPLSNQATGPSSPGQYTSVASPTRSPPGPGLPTSFYSSSSAAQAQYAPSSNYANVQVQASQSNAAALLLASSRPGSAGSSVSTSSGASTASETSAEYANLNVTGSPGQNNLNTSYPGLTKAFPAASHTPQDNSSNPPTRTSPQSARSGAIASLAMSPQSHAPAAHTASSGSTVASQQQQQSSTKKYSHGMPTAALGLGATSPTGTSPPSGASGAKFTSTITSPASAANVILNQGSQGSSSSISLLERSRAAAAAGPGAGAGSAVTSERKHSGNAGESIRDRNFKQAVLENSLPHGLPPTPRVHMGACLAKVFEGCPLKINSIASWVRPEEKEQFVIFGTNEGIYTLNLNALHENSLELLHSRKCTWLYVVKNVLFSVGGSRSQLYRHDLVALFQQKQMRANLPFGLGNDQSHLRIPEKLMPRRLQATGKVAGIKDCARVCIGRNPYNGFKFLCAAILPQSPEQPSNIALLQWYDPLEKFMFIKMIECTLPSPLLTFEMLIFPNAEFPFICVGVFKSKEGLDVKFHLIDLNSKSDPANAASALAGTALTSSSSMSSTGSSTPDGQVTDRAEQNSHEIAGLDELPIVHISQLERDTVLICYEKAVRMVTLNGKQKTSRRMLPQLRFDFTVETIVCLPDSVLAFYKHGVQGRHLKSNEITQEIRDQTKIFRLLGSERVIMVESRPFDDPMSNSNLYVLTGAQDSTIALNQPS